jgi:endonuclease III
MVDQGFLKATHREMIIVDTDIMRLLDRMSTYQAPSTEQWITEEKV